MARSGAPRREPWNTSNLFPLWTPDGKRVAFRSYGAKSGFDWAPADGSGRAEALLDIKAQGHPGSWSPDRKALLFTQVGSGSRSEIWLLPLDSDRKPRPLLQGPFNELYPAISPDGRWLAYTSGESGGLEVYVQPFPGPGGKWQLSTDGGLHPRWARSGRELFYRSGNRVMAVDVEPGPAFRAGVPKLLFEGVYRARGWDVAPDGKRFLMVKGSEQGPATQAQVVVDWFEDLKRRVPTGKK